MIIKEVYPETIYDDTAITTILPMGTNSWYEFGNAIELLKNNPSNKWKPK
jgi:hypothetical protein